MSPNSFDAALDFLPDARASRGRRFTSLVADVLEALSQGRDAETLYRREIARGTAPARAVEIAFGEAFKNG